MLRSLQRELREEHRRAGRASPTIVAEVPPSPPGSDSRLDKIRESQPKLGELLAHLDPAQRDAVFSDDPTVLVRAQVGSGKTTVLLHKVLYLHCVCRVPLPEIAVLTFTTRAAGEIRSRLASLVEGAAPTPENTCLMGTFHGVAHVLLSGTLPIERLGWRRGFSVLDEDAEAAFLAKVTSEAGLRTCRPRASRFRGRGNGKPSTELDARLAERKRAENVMSFDDLIDGAIALLKEPGESAARCKPQWILVDEGQDCASRELSFIDALRGPATRLFIVGDPLQSIYGWRGSAGAFFATPSQTPTVREYSLPTSYRSTRTILEGARAILGLQPHAAGILSPVRDVGEPIVLRRHHDPIAEAVYLADRVSDLLSRGFSTSEVAILARLKAQLEPIRRVLSERGLPIADDGTTRPDGVRLLTLHSAKGLEFRQVFISGVNQGLVPLAHGAVDDAEERRLLFVGMTRARDRVELGVHARPDQAYALGLPSPYLQTLPASLVEHRDGPEKPTEIALPTCAAGTTTSSSPWRVGQRAQHARYGIGVVTGVGETVICDFGKLGTREFPLRLCPLRLWLGVPQ